MLCGAIVAALSFSMISCDNDNGGGNGGSSATSVGVLHSGTALDNDLPDGYRIISVDDYTYYYDESGRLTGIAEDGTHYEFEKGTYNVRHESYGNKENISIKVNGKGCITSISLSYYEDEGDGDYEKGDGSMSFSYNGNNQLVSITEKATVEEREDGEKERGSYSAKYQFTYNGTTLTKATSNWEEKEDYYTYTGTWTLNYEYDDEIPNPFFQYTPSLFRIMDDTDTIEAFAYVGMFGKASSMLPTGVRSHETYYDPEDRDSEEWEDYDNCGSYSFNNYGAISRAEGYSYRYTSISSRSLLDYTPATKPMQNANVAQKFCHNKLHHKTHK